MKNADKKLKIKLEVLKDIISGYGKALVAFSGGVDSSFLLKICYDELGKENTLAITAESETYTKKELEYSKSFSKRYGINHIIISTCEFENENFVLNSPERCYYCKNELFSKLSTIAKEKDIINILDGTTIDDIDDYRPGRRAASELNIKSPLLEANFQKNEIRILLKEMNIEIWDKPASPCLASRIPYGQKITHEILEKIEKAENFLRKSGFNTVRARHHGKIVRLEVPENKIAELIETETRRNVDKFLKSLGYIWVTVDMTGYRTGSLNEVLSEKEDHKYRTNRFY